MCKVLILYINAEIYTAHLNLLAVGHALWMAVTQLDHSLAQATNPKCF